MVNAENSINMEKKSRLDKFQIKEKFPFPHYVTTYSLLILKKATGNLYLYLNLFIFFISSQFFIWLLLKSLSTDVWAYFFRIFSTIVIRNFPVHKDYAIWLTFYKIYTLIINQVCDDHAALVILEQVRCCVYYRIKSHIPQNRKYTAKFFDFHS